jgi:hypothetical protein
VTRTVVTALLPGRRQGQGTGEALSPQVVRWPGLAALRGSVTTGPLPCSKRLGLPRKGRTAMRV